MARIIKPADNKKNNDDESVLRVFFRGFFLPLVLVGRGFKWLSHKPPLKQIGHAFRWFFRLRAIRFIGRILGFNYFRKSWKELKQVSWPTMREGRRLTTAVIIFSLLFGVIMSLVDYGLDKLFKELLLK